jgi:sugar (pentulose or hexulose) kinase
MTAAVGLGIYPDFSAVEKVIRLSGAEFSPDPALRSLYDQAYVNFRSLYPPFSAIGKGQAVLEEPVSPAG